MSMGRPDRRNQLAIVMHGLFRYLVLLFSLPVLLLWACRCSSTPGRASPGRPVDRLAARPGVGAAFAASFLSVFRGDGPIYFEVGCVILVMTTLGRWLEATGRLKATAALDALARLLPDGSAGWSGRQEQLVPPRRSRSTTGSGSCPASGSRPMAGSSQRRPGGRAGADGREPARLKEPGDAILGGTLNLDGDLTCGRAAGRRNARPAGRAGQQARVEGALSAAGRPGRAWFFPAVAAIAVLAFVSTGLSVPGTGALAGLAVSLIACPCAWGWPLRWRSGARSAMRRASGSCFAAARRSSGWPRSRRSGSTRPERSRPARRLSALRGRGPG